MSQGEISFTLSEREDRNGVTYLFGSIRFINSVIFIRRDTENPKKWHASVKPYSEAEKVEKQHENTNKGKTR